MTKRLPLQLPDWLDFSMVALVCSVIVGYLLCRVLVSIKTFISGKHITQYLLCLERNKRNEKMGKGPKKKRDEEGKKYQICVFFAQRRVCLQADIDNFLAPQNM